MIDFNASTIPLPNPNDYIQDNTGKFISKQDIRNDPNTKFVDPNAGFLESSLGKLKADTLEDDPSRLPYESTSFEEMFDAAPDELKEKLLFHLDLFR